MIGVHQRNKILSNTAVKSEVNTTPLNRRVNSFPVERNQLEIEKSASSVMPSTDIFLGRKITKKCNKQEGLHAISYTCKRGQ